MFVERDRNAYRELEAAVRSIDDVEIELINGAFEEHIEDISAFARSDFSLIFIDPTGWQGYSLDKITPLLLIRGEVMINFMSDFINRFISDPRPEIASTFDALFGGDWFVDWQEQVQAGLSREAAAIEVYTERLKKAGNFNYVTSTRILKPLSDRSYFYLIYATRNWKGIKEFRDVEKRAVDEQERIRVAAKYKAVVSRTKQEDLFGPPNPDLQIKTYEDERKSQLKIGYERLLYIMSVNKKGIKYQEIIGFVLQTPLVWEGDLKAWLTDLRNGGRIIIPELTGRERVPKVGYTIVPILP
tara:strand:+ start:73 stop:972 length:900 start_codon:yes stop_codon:yes gene_type:complete